MKIMKTLGFASVVLFLVVSVMYIILFIPLNNQKVLIDIKKIRNRNNGLISKEATLKIYKYEDTSLTRFDVGNVKLKFHPAFKNPCFLEYINESVTSVYDHDRFVIEEYTKKGRLGDRVSSQMDHNRHGVVLNNTDLCGPIGICRLRCLPYFMLIGAAKCGTSDFAQKATSHPQILGAVNKELFYWTQFRFLINATIGDYSSLFDPAVLELLKQKETRNGRDYYPQILSEYTSQTFGDDPHWRLSPKNKDAKEPVHLKVHDIYRVNPNIKIIVILRKPANKLYSSYNMFRRLMLHNPQDFHDRVLLSIEWWNNCTKKLGLPVRTCAYSCVPEMPPVICQFTLGSKNQYWSDRHLNYSAEILRAMYSVFAKDWLSVFPRKQILFLRTEDSYNMSQVMNEKVLPFVGMKKVSKVEDPTMYSQKHSNSRSYKPMLKKTKKLLEEFYAPFNEELANTLGDKKWLWKDID